MSSPQHVTAQTWEALNWVDTVLLYQDPSEKAFDDFWSLVMQGENPERWTVTYVGRQESTDREVYELNKLDTPLRLLRDRAESSIVSVCERSVDGAETTPQQQPAATATPLLLAVQTGAR